MRSIALVGMLLLTAFGATACGGGPDDPDASLRDACSRQLKEVSEETSGTPTAKSSEERLDKVTLSECAGQDIHLEPNSNGDDDGSSQDSGTSDAGTDTGSDSDSGSTGTDGGTGDSAGGDSAGGDTAGGDTTAVKLDAGARDTFAKTCGVCHTLSDAGTNGQVGPVLDETKFDADMVEERIHEGAQGMPANLLQGDEARGVAEYVAAAAAQAQAGE